MNSKVLLHSAGSRVQHPVIDHDEKDPLKDVYEISCLKTQASRVSQVTSGPERLPRVAASPLALQGARLGPGPGPAPRGGFSVESAPPLHPLCARFKLTSLPNLSQTLSPLV